MTTQIRRSQSGRKLPCEYCKKLFTPSRSDARYCPPPATCKAKARARRDAEALFATRKSQAERRLINIGVGAERTEWFVAQRKVAQERSSRFSHGGLCFLATQIGMLVIETEPGALQRVYGRKDGVVRSRSDDSRIVALLSQERFGASFIVQEAERDFRIALRRQIAKHGGSVDVWLLPDEWADIQPDVEDQIKGEIQERESRRAADAKAARARKKAGVPRPRKEKEETPRITFVSYDAGYFERWGVEVARGQVRPRISRS